MAVATREKPILFSTALVPPVMSGAKTQTRRLLKPQPLHAEWFEHQNGWIGRFRDDGGTAEDPAYRMLRLPYQVGDLLYVRETWAEADDEYGGPCLVWAADRMAQHIGRDEAGIDSLCGDSHKFECDVDRWRPSIHLPKWAARTWLEVVGVKVERLCEISEEDAIAEGCDGGWEPVYYTDGSLSRDVFWQNAREEFAKLWDSLSKPGSQWADNPYVAAYSFRRIER